MDNANLLEKLHATDRECCHLEKAAAMLQWDQEVYLPEMGVEGRADQLALLEGIIHERFTSPKTGELLAGLGSVEGNPQGDEKLPAAERDFLKAIFRKYNRAVKLPKDFVIAAARAEGLSHAAWVKARQGNDFRAFLPHLVKMIDFARQKAVYLGSVKNPYDGLLDIYEPGMDSAAISSVFGPLRERLSALLKKIASRSGPDLSFLKHEFDTSVQARFNSELMKKLGFDFRRGRIDTSAHPFTTTLGADDIRITTRFDSANIFSAIFSTIHECGHAFYEMAFPYELRGSSLADGASMGIHESQSRFWENVIGRSLYFWEKFFPMLRSYFPDTLGQVNAETFYKAVNEVRPSLIRVDADEVSYSLHVILRFELEKQLFSGELDPSALPSRWQQLMKEILGVEPETDAEGVLQDVHWAGGAFGYFPSYALGNLYGLQFCEKLKADLSTELPNFPEGADKDNFSVLHSWLKENIYVWGCRLEPQELLKKVTGQSLMAEPFLNYIEKKYSNIY
ncbi:MAG: carboxypeptidase M32 [Treponema sp.]|jgi:carboxypeptidase Taq|nr:carboxypeptidase M32 [Treponema sp.]